MAEINNALRFDTGLAGILQQTGPEEAQLPNNSKALPGETSYEHRLNDVLYPPSMEQSLLESLRPDVNERDVLSPHKYETLVDLTQQGLSEAGLSLDSAEAQDQIRDTAQLLEEEKDLRGLLNTYRHFLHRA